MTSKKGWISKGYCDSQEKLTQVEISWSSSDSEPEPPLMLSPYKKRKIEVRQSKSWIQFNKVYKESLATSFKSNDVCDPPACESPIIGKVRHEEQSPTLTQFNTFFAEQSPVINRRQVVKRIRQRFRLKLPQGHVSESSRAIDSETSPLEIKLEVAISPAKSDIEASQPYSIDPFPSQNSSETDRASRWEIQSGSTLYHEPPIRKKRVKKGGLASQLRKVLDVHNTSLAIWEHENFLFESKGERIKNNVSEPPGFKFLVLDKRKEYNCGLLVCKCCDTREELQLFAQFSENFDCRTFYIVVGFNNVSCNDFQIGSKWRVFAPYFRRIARQDFRRILCVVNASRFVAEQ